MAHGHGGNFGGGKNSGTSHLDSRGQNKKIYEIYSSGKSSGGIGHIASNVSNGSGGSHHAHHHGGGSQANSFM